MEKRKRTVKDCTHSLTRVQADPATLGASEVSVIGNADDRSSGPLALPFKAQRPPVTEGVSEGVMVGDAATLPEAVTVVGFMPLGVRERDKEAVRDRVRAWEAEALLVPL